MPKMRDTSPVPPQPRSAAGITPRQPQLPKAFLPKSLGLPWFDVSKSIRAQLKLDSESDKVFTRLGIATRTVSRNGQALVLDALRGHVTLENAPFRYYVDPVTKVLAENQPYLRKQASLKAQRDQLQNDARARRRELSETVQVHRVLNGWVAVELAPLDGRQFDVLLSKHVAVEDRQELALLYGRPGVYARVKRELNYRELRELGLLESAV